MFCIQISWLTFFKSSVYLVCHTDFHIGKTASPKSNPDQRKLLRIRHTPIPVGSYVIRAVRFGYCSPRASRPHARPFVRTWLVSWTRTSHSTRAQNFGYFAYLLFPQNRLRMIAAATAAAAAFPGETRQHTSYKNCIYSLRFLVLFIDRFFDGTSCTRGKGGHHITTRLLAIAGSIHSNKKNNKEKKYIDHTLCGHGDEFKSRRGPAPTMTRPNGEHGETGALLGRAGESGGRSRRRLRHFGADRKWIWIGHLRFLGRIMITYRNAISTYL